MQGLQGAYGLGSREPRHPRGGRPAGPRAGIGGGGVGRRRAGAWPGCAAAGQGPGVHGQSTDHPMGRAGSGHSCPPLAAARGAVHHVRLHAGLPARYRHLSAGADRADAPRAERPVSGQGLGPLSGPCAVPHSPEGARPQPAPPRGRAVPTDAACHAADAAWPGLLASTNGRGTRDLPSVGPPRTAGPV